MKFKIGQPLILDESLKDRAYWYKPGIFYLKKRYPSGTVKANKQDYLKNKNLIDDDGTWKNELVECYNFEGESLICTETTYAYTVICNDNKCRKISKEIIETGDADVVERSSESR